MTPIYGLKNGQIKSLTVQTEEAVLSGFFPVCYSDKNFVNSSPEKPLFYLRIETNSADPNQTASEEAVWSGSSLFVFLTSILWIPALKFIDLFENRERKVFKILEN